MGQSQNPISSTTQQLNQLVSAVVDVNGAATFTFQSPPSGQTWTGTLQCPGAPATAIFAATIGATQWCDWAGNSIGGPVQCFGQGAQQLVVTGSGLTPGATNEMVWIGSSDGETLTQPIWPDPNTSALTAQVQAPAPQLLGSTPAGLALNVTSPNGIRTLILNIVPTTFGATVTNVKVYQNGGSLYPFYNQPPYLANNLSGGYYYQVVVPVFPVQFALGYVVNVTCSTGTAYIYVYGDSAQYDESVFYNGPVTTVSASGPGTLVNGPCRLLALTVAGGASGALIQRNVPAAGALLAASTGLYTALSFGSQGIIIPYGDYLSLTGGGGGTVTYAYP